MKFGIKPISQFRRNLKKNKRLDKICRFPHIFGILNYNGIHKRHPERIIAAPQKADFPVPNAVLWLIKIQFSAITVVLKNRQLLAAVNRCRRYLRHFLHQGSATPKMWKVLSGTSHIFSFEAFLSGEKSSRETTTKPSGNSYQTLYIIFVFSITNT